MSRPPASLAQYRNQRDRAEVDKRLAGLLELRARLGPGAPLGEYVSRLNSEGLDLVLVPQRKQGGDAA